MGGDVSDPPESVSFTEAFLKLEPLYLSFGMGRDEFWHGEPRAAKVYRQAFEIQRRRQNTDAWRDGQYTLAALQTALGALFAKNKSQIPRYPEEPFPLTDAEAEEQAVRRQLKMEEALKARLLSVKSITDE